MNISHYLRNTVFGIILVGLFTTFLYERLSNWVGTDSNHKLAEKTIFAKCTKGERPALADEVFLLRFVAVEDSQTLREEMENQSNDYANILTRGLKSGKVKKISTNELLTVHIQDVSLTGPGLEVPLLLGDGVCERMISVDRVQDREFRFVVPVVPDAPQTAVVFPRKLFENSPNVRICAQPTFLLANATETRQNMYCAINVAPSAARGALARTFVLLRST